MSQPSRKVAKRVGIGLLALLCVILFASIRPSLLELYMALGATWELFVSLLSITFIAILFSGLLIPLEALGWWAGWYGDQVDTTIEPGKLAEPIPTDTKITRYVIYLDGISQAQFQYLPEVERFLNELATQLPDDIAIIRGLMSYSVLNRPLTENGLLSFFWRIADRFQMTASGGLIGALIGATINIRNIMIVSVAADQRYGPIYNQGTAQILYNSLINHGYQPGSGIPITLLGYSGGAQIAVGAAPYLKRALKAPIEAISLSGVMSGNHNILQLEHLYHLVGKKDLVEKEGPILFPRRWQIWLLSYWNRAKRLGKISFISLGPVGHNGIQGPYSIEARLPDGRTHLQQTVELIAEIIQGDSPLVQTAIQGKISNYELYQRADFNHPSYYPLAQSVDPTLYRPIAPWMGRLILPSRSQRRQVKGVLFEVYHTDLAHQHLVGQIVNLRWNNDPNLQAYMRSLRKDVHFSDEAKSSQRLGYVHPCRLDGWRQVDPLESLAGSRPNDDVIVKLREPVVVEPEKGGENRPTLRIWREPVQITGRFYGLVKILEPVTEGGELFRVVHFNPTSRQFDGIEEIVRIPQVIPDQNGVFPSTSQDIEKVPLNHKGWYIYGAQERSGLFVVQAIAPRTLLRLQPHEVIVSKTAAWQYLKYEAWQIKGEKGKVKSVLMVPREESKESGRAGEWDSGRAGERESGRAGERESGRAGERESGRVGERESGRVGDGENYLSPTTHYPSPFEEAISQWKEGDRALVLHVYGGIGGKKQEPAAKTPIFFGHFAYGVAQVVREPLSDELNFDIDYYQVYTHNPDGIIAGILAWNRFIGDRQFGWLGTRPVADILIKFDALTENFDINGIKCSALDVLVAQLEAMTARYRIGDGTGGTYVGFAHNCAQDSNQAIYTALKRVRDAITSNPQLLTWLRDDPGEAEQFEQLVKLGTAIKRQLMPFGSARADWQNGEETLGISPEEDFWQGLIVGLGSWRTMLPRLASERITKQFIKQGASVWVLRTNQVGGYDADIEPIAPTLIGW